MCLFFKIITKSSYKVLHVAKAEECIQDRCCYFDGEANYIYDSSTLPSATINSTTCSNWETNCPYFKVSEKFMSFYNNHSFFSKTSGSYGSCYCIKTCPGKAGTNCFFSGTSSTVNFPVHFDAKEDGDTLSQFNIVNNTDSKGYFRCCTSKDKIVSNSVISFTSQEGSLKWFELATGTLTIEHSFIIASGSIPSHKKLTIGIGAKCVNWAPTLLPFRSHPYHKQCSYFFKIDTNLYSSHYRLLCILHLFLSLLVPMLLK